MNFDSMLAEALNAYAIENPFVTFIRHNENATFKVCDRAGKQYLLRIHRPREGFSSELFETSDKEASILGELGILQSLAMHTDIPVQKPVLGREGSALIQLHGGEYVTMLTWLDGQTLEQTEITPEILREAGRMTARMHACFQTLQELPKPAGHDYDKALMIRMAEKLRGFCDEGLISKTHMKAMTDALTEIMRRMAMQDEAGGLYGVIHSDLSKSNMLLCKNEIAPIDFGLWGYGYYAMDLGLLFSHFTESWEQEAIMEGYESITGHGVDPYFVEPFESLGILLYVCTFARGVCKEDWFPKALDRWCSCCFIPLAGGGTTGKP